VTDVYEAVLQGADAVMLSGETSIGAHPVEAVRVMDRIAQEAQSRVRRDVSRPRFDLKTPTLLPLVAPGCEGIVRALTSTQQNCQILCISHTGTIAVWLSSLRLPVPILAFTNDERTMRQFNIMWGVRGILWHKHSEPSLLRQGSLALMGHADNAEKNYFRAIKKAVELHLLQESDVALVVSSSLSLGHDGGINISAYNVRTVLST
jgi:pyruvate kinase